MDDKGPIMYQITICTIFFDVGMTLSPFSNLHVLTSCYLDEYKLIFQLAKMLHFIFSTEKRRKDPGFC